MVCVYFLFAARADKKEIISIKLAAYQVQQSLNLSKFLKIRDMHPYLCFIVSACVLFFVSCTPPPHSEYRSPQKSEKGVLQKNGDSGSSKLTEEREWNDAPDEPISIGDTLQGKIVKINDGDTYELLLPGNRMVRVRMEGIDAPEGGMPYYRVSKKYLTDMAANAVVKSVVMDMDHYDRLVCRTYLNDKELSAEMLKAGMAWHYKKYNSDERFAQFENEARRAELGLWKEKDPVSPWIHRRLRRQGISTKDLNIFSLKIIELSDENQSAVYRDFEFKKNNSTLNIRMKDGFTQAIKMNKTQKLFIYIADYNMDGHKDIMLDTGNDLSYFLYHREKEIFEYKKNWDFEVWKLNKPKKQILTTSSNTAYSGSVTVYQIGNENELQLLRKVNFNQE